MAVYGHPPCQRRRRKHVRPEPDFLKGVWGGLSQERKTLPCKYFYDERGSRLFDLICGLRDYYVTRTETEILEKNLDEICSFFGPECMVVDLGSGSSIKTSLLLGRLKEPAGYIPVDISRDYLFQTAALLSKRHRNLRILPVCADFNRPFRLPELPRRPKRTVFFFPGSTIGNFVPAERRSFLARISDLCSSGDMLLIGFDLWKEKNILERAYDDRDGVTAEFNKNILRRINAELEGRFDLGKFRHRAVVNEKKSRVEMHLVSIRRQTAEVAGRTFYFEAGETVHTENSHKLTEAVFRRESEAAGFLALQSWTDSGSRFCVMALQKPSAA